MILVTDPNTLQVLQGHMRVSETRDDVLVSILGSCVAACIRDPELKIGGMNHFLLPGADPSASSDSARYGARSMEDLVNALLRKGASRSSLEVGLFGGADVLKKSTSIGRANAAFARDFVRTEGFSLIQEDLGGQSGRRLRFHPYSGRMECVRMDPDPSLPVSVPAASKAANDVGRVELF